MATKKKAKKDSPKEVVKKASSKEVVKKDSPKKVIKKCTVCRKQGHNSRTCPQG